jgi:ABC-type lipoprotein export system ATPase subunit
MRNIVGQTPRGKDFFPRDKIVNLIYRRLNSGAHVYMAAPRRVGKTAIMRHLEDSPREGYEFKYIITESIDNPITFFEQLSDSLHHLKSLSKKSLDAINNFMPTFEKVSVITTGVDFKLAERNKVFEDFKKLIKGLDTQGKTVIIMMDEFPQTVENILRRHGKEGAEQFLRFNREIRHQANENIRFLLTGSIGLPTIAEKLVATQEINDLNVIEIPPLTREEAKALIVQLLDFENISYNEVVVDYLLDKMAWFVPFHIQLVVQELIDAYYDTEAVLNKAAVDKAFVNVLDKRNSIYFEHYYSRLEKTFEDGEEYRFALAVLQNLTLEDELTAVQLKGLAKEYNLTHYSLVLRTLNFEGYIFQSERGNKTVYRFTSLMLRLWWKQYVSITTESILLKTELETTRILEFSIDGLAGYNRVYSQKLNEDVNIFFGLNGSGKTSLLKILHSALSDNTDILEGVPFKRAAVKIYSIALERTFTRTIDTFDELVWTTEPNLSKFVAPHIYLSISRLCFTGSSELTEQQFEFAFAQRLQELWIQYFTNILSTINKAQNDGLADILKAMLSVEPQDKKAVTGKIDPKTAYQLAANFLERQGNVVSDILGSPEAFENRYLTEPRIQSVINDIHEIEMEIEQAMQPRQRLQQLIQDLFSGNKNVQFEDRAIEVKAKEGTDIGLHALSSGEKQLILILLQTFLAGGSSILIDEPEISMHIDWQEKLIDAMRQLNPSAQIILATHSPEIMVDVDDDRIFRL